MSTLALSKRPQTPSEILRASLVCFAASLFFFYEFFQLNMFNSINNYLLQEFHLSASQLGHLSAHYFYANILFLFPAGIILDRISTRKIIVCAMLLTVCSTAIFAHTHNLKIAQGCRFITGISGSFAFLSCLRLASRWFEPRHLALVIGLIVTMAMIGGMVAQTPMTLLTDQLGWRQALFIIASMGIVFLLIIFVTVRDYPKDRPIHHHTNNPLLPSLLKAIRNPTNWFAGIYTSMMNLPIFLLGAMWGGLYLVQIFHLTRTEASQITSMLFVGTIIGSPTIGWFSDVICRRKLPMLLCVLGSFAAIMPLIYLPHISVTVGMILFFAIGFFTSGQVISYPLIAESNPLAITGTASGIASTLIMGGGVFQTLFGWLMETHWDHKIVNDIPVYSLLDYRIALWIMPVGFLLALLVTWPIKETRCIARVY